MNFVQLVADGKYKKEELNEPNKNFVDGMEFVLQNVLTQDITCLLELSGTSETLAMIEREIAHNTVEAVKANVYVSICEMIVGMLDEQEETK